MSWWVMEQVSINEAGTQTLANIQCDDVSDLPAPNQSATLGYVIVRGSQAKVLATSENYILGSTGTWVKMEDGVKLDLAGYATEQYVDDGLAEKATVNDIYGIGVAIPSNSDLNDYRTGGNYYVVNNTVASTISNIPVSGSGFRLLVHTMNTTTYCRQEFYKVNQPEIIYVRTYNGVWTPWYKFQGVIV